MRQLKTQLTILLAAVATAVGLSVPCRADVAGDWRIHPPMDYYVDQVVDTPDVTYVTVLGMPYRPDLSYSPSLHTKYAFLYEYDKATDEFRAWTNRNELSEPTVEGIYYNPRKKYLMVVYPDCNIDVMEQDGTVHNIPGLKNAVVNGSKKVNDVTFDLETDIAYMATSFGYLEIDDKKWQIAESRNYGIEVTGCTRSGDNMLLATATGLLSAPYAGRRMNLDDYASLTGERAVQKVYPLQGGKALMLAASGSASKAPSIVTPSGDTMQEEKLASVNSMKVTGTRQGYLVVAGRDLLEVKQDGTSSSVRGSNEMLGQENSSWDFSEFWTFLPRLGLMSSKLAGEEWTVTREASRANSPAVFACAGMAYSPSLGMVCAINGADDRVFTVGKTMPLQLSALKDGHWSEYAPAYTYSERANILYSCTDVAVDPDNSQVIYAGSHYNGMLRIDTDNPRGLTHFSNPKDPGAGKEGYVEIVGANKTWSELCNFNNLGFDNDGNMFMLYTLGTSETNYKGPLWVWPSEKRRNLDVNGWTSIPVNSIKIQKSGQMLPLRHANNKNLVVLTAGNWEDAIVVIDHKGTVTDSSDDVIAVMSDLVDQDGSQVSKNFMFSFYEDPSTGYVWVGSRNGVFYFNPRDSFTNPQQVYRAKVSRNDGTNLADYLLDNINVYSITSDGQGRKWFGTSGGGAVCTSSDGRTVLQELVTENSYIPDDVVYQLAYNPDNNSMLMSTGKGIAEYILAGGTSGGSTASTVRAYPNPVRPDFYGWVTIDGLPENCLVKIVDSAGGLVRELGTVTGGSVEWDVCDKQMKRVQTGVYYVAVSGASEGDSSGSMTKIMVVN